MDDLAWYSNKLLTQELPLLNKCHLTSYLQSLSELELDLVKKLTSLEIIYRETTNGMTSLNRDDERESLL